MYRHKALIIKLRIIPGKNPAIAIPHGIVNNDDPNIVFHIENLRRKEIFKENKNDYRISYELPVCCERQFEEFFTFIQVHNLLIIYISFFFKCA